MRNLFFTFILLSFISEVFAQQSEKVSSIETVPEFPGGYQRFYKYISSSMQYPPVAVLLGMEGKLLMSFSVDEEGKVVEATPKQCIGAGCDAEGVRILQNSPRWVPGTQNGKPVRVQYTLPINFNIRRNNKVVMNELRKSEYQFVFSVNGKELLIDDAEKELGKTFPPEWVEFSDPYPYHEKYPTTKKQTFFIKVKKPS